jgi:hypothetical protein
MKSFFFVTDSELEFCEFRRRHLVDLKISGILTNIKPGENLQIFGINPINPYVLIMDFQLGDQSSSIPAMDYSLEALCVWGLENFLEMCKRLNVSGVETYYARRTLFSKLVSYWGGYLRNNPTNIIFFTTCPHEVVDFVLYLVAKAIGIEIVIMQDLHLFSRKIVSSSLQSPWDSIIPIDSGNQNLDQILEIVGNQKLDFIPAWMTKAQHNVYSARRILPLSNRFLLRAIMSHIQSLLLLAMGELGIIKKNRATILIRKQFRKLQDSFFHQEMLLTQSNLSLQRSKFSNTAPSTPFVLFCMNLDPEMMVNPLGYPFSSQLQAVAKLRELLPPHYLIAIREHPLQYESSSGYGTLGRTPDFYRIIQSIPNTIVTNSKIRLDSLVEKSEMVATLNGTVGWQSALSGKKVAILGNAWYQESPNTMRFTPLSTPAEMLDFIRVEETHSIDLFAEFLLNRFHNSVEYISSPEIASQLGSEWKESTYSITFKEMLDQILLI